MYIHAPALEAAAPTVFMAWLRARSWAHGLMIGQTRWNKWHPKWFPFSQRTWRRKIFCHKNGGANYWHSGAHGTQHWSHLTPEVHTCTSMNYNFMGLTDERDFRNTCRVKSVRRLPFELLNDVADLQKTRCERYVILNLMLRTCCVIDNKKHLSNRLRNSN
jgi:hypothetical protein